MKDFRTKAKPLLRARCPDCGVLAPVKAEVYADLTVGVMQSHCQQCRRFWYVEVGHLTNVDAKAVLEDAES